MTKKAYARKPSTREWPYDPIAARKDDQIPTKLAKLAAFLAEQSGGLRCSNAHALSVAVNEALAKRGIA